MVDISFLGCSRGLGAEVVKAYSEKHSGESGLLMARDSDRLQALAQSVAMNLRVEAVDFSKGAHIESPERQWKASLGRRAFYFAGGGPYGSYFDKNWRDHQWSFQVNFLTPAHLIHEFFRDQEGRVGSGHQFIVVGSAIADASTDPGASSYGAGKAALRRLVENLNAENPNLDLRLVRPGYMDTSLLPPNASPRTSGQALADPVGLAQQFVQWTDDPKGPKIWTP